MMEGTQCPICGKHVSGSVEETTRHVNMCIDNRQSLDLIGDMFTAELAGAALDGTRTFGYCPVCYKLTGVTSAHIKSCGKSKGIDTKELIRMCGPEPFEEKSKSKKTGKTGKGKTKKEVNSNPFGPGCTREIDDDPKKALKTDKPKPATEFLFKPVKQPKVRKPIKLIEGKEKKLIEKKRKPKVTGLRKGKIDLNQSILQTTTSGLIFKLSKPIGISNGELTKLSSDEKRERIKQRINSALANIIYPNNCISSYFQTYLPHVWELASLNCEEVSYIVEGFERFCPQESRESSSSPQIESVENAMSPTEKTMQIDEGYVSKSNSDGVLNDLSESQAYDTTANITMLELKDLTFSSLEEIPNVMVADRTNIDTNNPRDSLDISSSQSIPKSIFA